MTPIELFEDRKQALQQADWTPYASDFAGLHAFSKHPHYQPPSSCPSPDESLQAARYDFLVDGERDESMPTLYRWDPCQTRWWHVTWGSLRRSPTDSHGPRILLARAVVQRATRKYFGQPPGGIAIDEYGTFPPGDEAEPDLSDLFAIFRACWAIEYVIAHVIAPEGPPPAGIFFDDVASGVDWVEWICVRRARSYGGNYYLTETDFRILDYLMTTYDPPVETELIEAFLDRSQCSPHWFWTWDHYRQYRDDLSFESRSRLVRFILSRPPHIRPGYENPTGAMRRNI